MCPPLTHLRTATGVALVVSSMLRSSRCLTNSLAHLTISSLSARWSFTLRLSSTWRVVQHHIPVVQSVTIVQYTTDSRVLG
ncbi:hypothetical protein C8Q72DRAFT_198393 [Fomitopsis betulina]|nr:hypothetical protein C8Q72DRAFT_198393 [Fomitopsis betulina]